MIVISEFPAFQLFIYVGVTMWSTVMQLPYSHIYPDGIFFVVFLKPTGKTSMDHGNPNQWDGSAGDSVGWAWDGCTTLGWWFALWDTQVPINQQTWPIPEVIPQSEWQPYLVGGIPTPLKNMRVSWDDDILIGKWKKIWFQTTNQIESSSYSHCCWFIPYYVTTINITMFQSPPTSVCWFINHYNPHIPTSSLERTSKQHHLKRGSQPAGAFVDEFQARIVCRV